MGSITNAPADETHNIGTGNANISAKKPFAID